MSIIRDCLNRSIALLLVIAVLAVSCSMPATGPGRADPRELVSVAGRLVDENIALVREALREDLPEVDDLTWLDGYDIAQRALGEESGEAYLEFCIKADSFSSVDEVLDAASGLAPAEELERIRADVSEFEAKMLEDVSALARVLTPEEQEEFYAALRSLFVKTTVLLSAAVVYAFVPELVIWGKVLAASAVAVAAGVLSTTILTIIDHYKLDREINESFGQWLEDVTTTPSASWAVASAMINLGASLGRSPVLTAIIIGVFTLFNITDEVNTMLDMDFS